MLFISAQIDKWARKSPRFKGLVESTKLLVKTRWTKSNGKVKKFPTVVQLPLTYNCNSKCVMCNIWKMDYSNEMKIEEFTERLKDPIFSKVQAVGINGGEPSLIKELHKYAEEILKLPSLRSLNIISHGFNKKQLWRELEKIYAACKQKGVLFHVSISLDGYDHIHNTVRGLKVFKLTDMTIKEIRDNKTKYCDSLDIGCTVIKQNVDHMIEMDVYSSLNNFDVKYRLGIENKRIESDKLKDQYSLLYDNQSQSASEFFHSRFYTASNLRNRFKYFSIFHFLTAKKKKRLLGCDWQENGITIDSRGDIYYCAVASDKIGSLRTEKGKDVFWNDKNLAYRQSILDKNCDNCIHDYHGKPELRNVFFFLKEYFFDKLYWLKYYWKAKFI